MTSVAAVDTRSQPRAFWGIALFLSTEVTLLSTIFGTYWYLRFKSVHWPPQGIPEPKVLLPVVLTAVLVSTSVPMQLAYRAGKARRARAALLALLFALIVQSGYWAMQIHLFVQDLHDFKPQEHAYASIYYVLVGADHAHVALGLLINAFLVAKLVGGLTRYRVIGLQAATLYWHVVNLFTVFVVLIQISPSL
jgi:cytochrome c oxidase subunit 3/cytochrome c oxidase subunit I+III